MKKVKNIAYNFEAHNFMCRTCSPTLYTYKIQSTTINIRVIIKRLFNTNILEGVYFVFFPSFFAIKTNEV